MTVGTLRPRITPLRFTGKSMRLVERNLMVYRHVWGVLLSGFFEPLFYLFSVTIGLGELVGDIRNSERRRLRERSHLRPRLYGLIGRGH